MTDAEIDAWACQATSATNVANRTLVQSLWSGYGSISRLFLEGGTTSSVILKHIVPPASPDHPRGWATQTSDERKKRSYDIEAYWYRFWSHRCLEECRVPRFLALSPDGSALLLEDLDLAGFGERCSSVSEASLTACLSWLAHFHAAFLGETPAGLWPTGTYWHLATRQDELAALADEKLRDGAPKIDSLLSEARFQTIVHGDAKLANFCFSADGGSCAAVDFQYVGGGCGMKDLAYFIGSCFDETSCEAREDELLDLYFSRLLPLAERRGFQPAALEADWRPLYPVAWADFHRFLKGWSPEHWKLTDYSERVSASVLLSLE